MDQVRQLGREPSDANPQNHFVPVALNQADRLRLSILDVHGSKPERVAAKKKAPLRGPRLRSSPQVELEGQFELAFGRPAALSSKLVRELGFGLLSKLFQAGVRDIPLRAKR